MSDQPHFPGRRAVLAAMALGPALAAPAVAQGRQRLRLGLAAGGAVAQDDLAPMADRLAAALAAVSDGALGLEVTGAAGLDTLAAGSVDAVLGAQDAWLDADPAFGLFTGCPLGLTPTEFEAFVLQGGGQEMWDRLCEPFGIKALFAGDTGPRVAGWFPRELGGAPDFNGLEVRAEGLGAVALQGLGARIVPADGAVAAESLGLAADLNAGAAQRFAVVHGPALTRPHCAVALSIGRASWDRLSEGARAQIESVTLAEADAMAASALTARIAAEAELASAGKEILSLAPAIYGDIGPPTAEAVAAHLRDRSALRFGWEDYRNFVIEVAGWSAIGDGAFALARARALGV
ncbi:MAG: hypothetical protein AAGE76_14805 [Pseudomonadota bacterium]